jgi:hypothetical protein
MRYYISCPQCSIGDQFIVNVSPNNSGIYEINCPEGHEYKLDILSNHFQVLFENAIHSLADKYFIESFTSFASSYERFLEFFIKVVYLSNNINKEEFEETWKLMSSRSERQQGAFIVTYLNEFNKKPQLLSNKMTELRNKVIHKGYFPSEEDCINFGNAILEVIRPIILVLKNEKKYEWQLIGAINNCGLRYTESDQKIMGYLPYQIFPINRKVNSTDKKTISDFIEDQNKIKKSG